MKYQEIAHLDREKFRRLTGVKPSTFRKMLEILTTAHKAKKSKCGRLNSIEVSQMLLMTLEYIRECRTYFHIGVNYGISESYAYKTIRWVEDTLTSALSPRILAMASNMISNFSKNQKPILVLI